MQQVAHGELAGPRPWAVNAVVPREKLEETAEEMAEQIAMCPVTTLTACKLFLKRAWELMGFRAATGPVSSAASLSLLPAR